MSSCISTVFTTADVLPTVAISEMFLKKYVFTFSKVSGETYRPAFENSCFETDFVDEKIRNGLLSREKAIEIVKVYDGVCSDEIIAKFSAYVGISVEEFWQITNKWVNKDLFEIHGSNRPVPKFEVGVDYDC